MDDRGLERALQVIFGRAQLRRLVDREARAIADALRSDGEAGKGPDDQRPVVQRLPDGRLIAFVATVPHPTVYVIEDRDRDAGKPAGRSEV